MANSKSDKPLVRNLIIGCVIAILIFHFAWTQQYFTNLHNILFLLVDFGLLALFAVQAMAAYKYADDPNKDKKRFYLVIIAVASIIWAASWSAGLNERVGL